MTAQIIARIDAFDALVEKHMADNGVEDEHAAMAAVMETEKGQSLYSKIERSKQDARLAAQGISQN